MNSFQLIGLYARTRFGLGKFVGFATLLCFLGYHPDQKGWELVQNFLLVWTSLWVFRILDDAWSFYFDRPQFPERQYLHPAYFQKFTIWGIVSFIAYWVVLKLYFPQFVYPIEMLYGASILAYIFSYQSRTVMRWIPLCKYPVFLATFFAGHTDEESYRLAAASFMMVAAVDFAELIPEGKWLRLFKWLSFVVLGALVGGFPSGDESLLLHGIIWLAPSLTLLLPSLYRFGFFPLILFPVLHLFLSLW